MNAQLIICKQLLISKLRFAFSLTNDLNQGALRFAYHGSLVGAYAYTIRAKAMIYRKCESVGYKSGMQGVWGFDIEFLIHNTNSHTCTNLR